MPGEEAALAAAGQASAQIGGIATNWIFGRDAEKRQQNYNQRVYERNRTDALADWNRQNEYNSPQEQMRRFKAAGLNPNLIYGSATSSPSAPIKQSESGSFTPIVPKVDPSQIGDTVNTYFNVLKQKAEISNLEATNEQIKANTNYLQLKAVTEGSMPENVKSKTDLNIENSKKSNAQTHLTQLQDSQLSELFPIVKQIKTNTALNLLASTDNYKANTSNLNARTKTEDQTREAKVQKAYADIYNVKMNSLLKEYQQETENQKKKKLEQEIINLKSKGDILDKDNTYYETGAIKNLILDIMKFGK